MKVSIEELKDLANRLKFDMQEDEYKTLQDEFEVVLSQMEMIGKIEGADEVEPMTFPFIYEAIGLREDEPGEVLTKEEVLKNASDVSYDQVRVKKVI